MYKKIVLWLLLVCAAFLGGCIPQQQGGGQDGSLQDGATKKMVDAKGYTVDVPMHPMRVLTLTSAFDTILVDLLPPDRIVATSTLSQAKDFSINWKEAKKVKTAIRTVSLEGTIKLKPDLVFAPEYASQDVLDGLRGMGIPVFVLNQPKTVDQVLYTIDTMGKVLGETDKSSAMISRVKDQIDYLQGKIAQIPEGGKRSVLFQSSMDGYTGKSSLFDDMCRYMGVYNAPTRAGYPERTSFTDERIIAMDPDVFLIPVYGGTKNEWVESFTKNPAYQSMKSRQNNTMKTIPAKYLYTGNQYIGFAMIRVMSEVYPSLFTEEDRKRYPIAYEQ